MSWNKPFKDATKSEYNNWMEFGSKTFTTKNNIRAPSRKTMAEFIVNSWSKVTNEIIANSFHAVGQLRDTRPEQIHCLKEGNIAHEILDQIKKFWDADVFEEIEIIEEPEDEQDTVLDEDE